MQAAVPMITNESFAEATGCTFTMASRLRNGQRRPSVALLQKIIKAYNLDPAEALEAHTKGQADFGAYLRKQVFERS